MTTSASSQFADQGSTNHRAAEACESLWHATAAERLVQYNDLSAGTPGWDAWNEHLSRRKQPALPASLMASRTPPLLWSVPQQASSQVGAATIQLLEQTAGALAKRKPGKLKPLGASLGEWLAEAQGAPPSPALALEAIAWSQALPALAPVVPAELWWDTFDQLVQLTGSDATDLLADAWTQQLIAVELPATLAWALPELSRTAGLAQSASAHCRAGLAELLDGRGTLHGRYFSQLRPLLACWTRVVALAEGHLASLLDDDDRNQFQRLVRSALRFTRPDGSMVFSTTAAQQADRDLLNTAARLAGDRKTLRAAEQLFDDTAKRPKKKPRKKQSGKKKSKQRPSPAAQSEWAEVAVLQPQFSGLPAKLAINYTARRLQTELTVAGAPLLTGDWQPAVEFNGRRLEQQDDWEDVCWSSDEDSDYLELQADFSDGVRIQRQMMLARDDHILVVCDALLGSQPGDWHYRLALPLANGATFEQALETRDGYLCQGAQRRALVLPLALPEWRVDPRQGSLKCDDDDELVLAQQASGAQAMFVPLLVDVDPRRLDRQPTWRRLTVAKDRIIEQSDVAVGYRAQVGKQHWLIYRSLAQQGNRTLLGHNLVTEFLVARFRRGQIDPLMEIE